MSEQPGNISGKSYRKSMRIFENSGTIIPGTMIDRGRYFPCLLQDRVGRRHSWEEIRAELQKDKTYVVVLLGYARNQD